MPYAALPSLLQNDVALHVRCTATVYSTASNTVAIVAIALHAVCSECVQKQFSAAVKIFCYYYRVSQKKRSLRIFTPLGATDASGDNSVGQGCWGDVG